MPQDHIAWGFEAIDKRAKHYALFRDYYDGDHRLLFVTEKFLNAFGPQLRAMADNICPAPVDAIRDSLILRGFTGPAGDAAWQAWLDLGLDRRSADVHAEAAKCGDQFVIVWPDATMTPRVWPQVPENCAVLYDDEEDPERIVRGIKAWQPKAGPVAGRWRVNLYYPDVIERWVSTARKPTTRPKPGAFVPYDDHPDTLPAEVANPWGTPPIVHFANNAQNVGELGRSELANAIPLQDGLNKTLCDLLVTGEFHALPQRYATGVQVEVDPVTGRPRSPWTSQPGGVWTIPSETARAGTFDAADLRQFLEVVNDFRLEVARVTATPLTWFQLTTEPPSGESLKTLEGRFVKKCGRRMADWGPRWVQIIRLVLRMSAGADAPDLAANWEPAGSRDELHESMVQESKLRIHGSWRQSMRELGYDDDAILKIADERDNDAQARAAAQVAAFDRGVEGLPSGQFAAVA